MEENIFLLEESDEGGYTAKGMGVSIFTEAGTIEELRIALKDAIRCHFPFNKNITTKLHFEKT
jgi:hypothetical protein